MRQFWQDVRYSVRALGKSPGFLLVAILTLALGIGANTAIFAVVNTVILRALPVSHPEQLALLTDPDRAATNVETTERGDRSILSYPEFVELRNHNSVFSGIFAAQSQPVSVDVTENGTGGASIKARVQLVSGEFFDVLGVRPALGRAFAAAEDKAPGANPVAILSDSFWRRALGADPAVAGKTLRIGGGIFRVIGVAPPGFHGILVGSDSEIWLPITMQAQALPGLDYLKPRDTLWLQVMGRLAPGMSLARAEAGINVGFQQFLREWAATEPTPKAARDMLDQRIKLREGAAGASALRGQFSDPLKLLMAMVGLVLLIACANIANLLLARASGRTREVGIRLALGASRVRILRQLLTESLLIAAAGGALGMALAFWTTRVLLTLVQRGFDGVSLDPARDIRVLLFTATATLATALLFGLAPALRAARSDLASAIASNVRGAAGMRGRLEAGRILVIAQVTLSLLLTIGAALFVRTLHNLLNVHLGIDRAHLLVARIDPSAAGYTQAELPGLCERIRQRLQGIPGVRAASISNDGLFTGDEGDHVAVDGALKLPENEMSSLWTLVGPDYLRTVGIPLLRGRAIDASDMAAGRPVCVVNATFVKRFFGDADPLGLDDTIVAIATPPGRGGIGVVRIAGPRAREIAEPMLRLKHQMEPGRATFGELLEPAQEHVGTAAPHCPAELTSALASRIDEVVVTYFAKPHSYTTDDVVEIAAHGSPVRPSSHRRVVHRRRSAPRRTRRVHHARLPQWPHRSHASRSGTRSDRVADALPGEGCRATASGRPFV